MHSCDPCSGKPGKRRRRRRGRRKRRRRLEDGRGKLRKKFECEFKGGERRGEMWWWKMKIEI